MKLNVTFTRSELLEVIAKGLGIRPADIELTIVDDDEQIEIAQQSGKTFLQKYEEEQGLDHASIAKMAGLSSLTINRACKGYYLKPKAVNALREGLNLTDEQVDELKRTMSIHHPPRTKR